VTISVIALVIALCSLLWNVVSTSRTWHMNSPRIKMNVSAVHYSDSPSLRIEIQNRGGSSIAVMAIYIWSQWDKDGREGLAFQIRREVAGKKGRSSGVDGPTPPVTVEGHNAQSWVIEPALVDQLMETSDTASILIEAQLANGQSVKQEMTSLDIY
jgi:hypothetical protein